MTDGCGMGMVERVDAGPVAYRTEARVGRVGDLVWLALAGGQDGTDWEQRAFGPLSPAGARRLAALLLVAAEHAAGRLPDAAPRGVAS